MIHMNLILINELIYFVSDDAKSLSKMSGGIKISSYERKKLYIKTA